MSEGKVCRFCKEAPDGDKYSFVDEKATRCNRVPCLIAWQQEYDREMRKYRDYRRLVADRRRKDEARRGKRRLFRRA